MVVGNHYRQRNFSGSGRDDASRRLGSPRVSRLDGRRVAFFFRRAHLRGTGRDEAAGRRRVCICSRCLWPARGISLFLDDWFLISKPASIATITTGLVRILETFPVFSFLTRPFFSELIRLAHFHDRQRTTGRDRSDHFDFRAELHRRPPGGRISVPLHATQSRNYRRDRCRRLLLPGRNVG